MKQRCTTHAFTLVELLVALAITAMLAALMVAVTSGPLSTWRRAQDAFSADAQAKLALDFLERDLQAAIFRENGNAWLAVDILNSSSALSGHGWLTNVRSKPGSAESQRYVPFPETGRVSVIADARFGMSGGWLRFITTNVETKDSGNPGGSLPVAVAYQIARRPVAGAIAASNPAAVRYSLFRSAVANDITFSTGLDVLANSYSGGGTSPAASRAARTLTNANNADALAIHVVDFGVWLHRRDGSGEWRRIFPATANDATHAASLTNDFPEAVDVMVRVLTGEGASLISAIEAGEGAVSRPAEYADDAAWWWAVVEKHSRVYVRRVEVKGAR